MALAVILAPTIIFLMVALVKSRREHRHELVLYEFCEIRRDAMAMLRVHGDTMEEKEFGKVRRLVEVLSDVIHHYDEYKWGIFNLRKVLFNTERVKGAIQWLNNQPGTNEDIQKLNKRLVYAMAKAFIVHTPFFTEFVLRVIAGLLKRIGVQKYHNGMRRLADLERWFKQNRHGRISSIS